MYTECSVKGQVAAAVFHINIRVVAGVLILFDTESIISSSVMHVQYMNIVMRRLVTQY